jgi:hypothetical protein
VQSELDKAGKKGVLHKNKVARKKAQAARNAKAAGVPAGVKTDKVKAAPTKKTSPAKKTVAKKAPAKKPAVKKPATKK